MTFTYRRTYQGKIKAVIFDWAGTTIDFGTMAPPSVFLELFARRGVAITLEEARIPSGNPWRAYIKKISLLDSVNKRWREAHGSPCSDEDVDAMHADFAPVLCDCLARYSSLIPGFLDVLEACRSRGYKIGSLTGYLTEMLAVIRKEGEQQGYVPDSYVCASDVPAGRPYPYMCLLNMINLQVWPTEACVKVDDIMPGIEEGLNAGMWTVGLAISGNQVGLPLEAWEALSADEKQAKRERAYTRLKASGAHYVIDTVADLMPCLDGIEARLACGEKP